MLRMVACVLLLLLVLAPSVRAEDAAEDASPEVAIPHGDFLTALGALEDGVAYFVARPADAGLYGKHDETWKRYAKPRAKRMRSRVTLLRKPKLWILTEGDAPKAIALDEGSWSALVKGLTSLYAELGTMRARYAEQRVTSSKAERAWLRRYPRPEPIGRVPSRDALEDADRAILEYRLAGEVVPYRLISLRARLAEAVAREEEEARERKRREYERRKYAAFAEIERHVTATNGALAGDVDRLRGQQQAVQDLVAAAQASEEARLKKLVADAPKTGNHLKDTATWFQAMAEGRHAAQTFRDKRSARWGSLVRQKWMTFRPKLLAAIKKAHKADAGAKAQQAAAGDGE